MSNRYYPVGDKELASVTTITGLADKSDALIPWAVNCAVDYVVNKLYAFGPRSAQLGLDELQDARTKWREVRDEAGDIGTQVHDALEAYLNGVRESGIAPQPDDVGYLIANSGPAVSLFKSAVDKLKALGPYKVLATEQKVVNEDEWYAGRFDALLEVDGETWLIDFKTGASFYPEWGMQLAAYTEAWEQAQPYETYDERYKYIDRIKVLRLDKKTLKAHWKEYGGEKDTLTRAWYYRAFLGLRDAFYVLKAKKSAKQAFMESEG